MIRPIAIAAAALAALSTPARGFDAATTHAGLTERAALASRLGAVLKQVFGRPLGLWEPLRLDLAPSGERGFRIAARLAKLDPSQGYAPDRGRLAAIEWLVAGSVVEEVPAERGRNHFYDPLHRRGLDQGGFLTGLGIRVAGASDGSGSLRGVFTGSSFDGTGHASVEWLNSADNDLSLDRFLDARERAAAGAAPVERERALAESLLVAGALLHVIEDAADPAHVRNDYRVAMAERGAPLRSYLAARYGRLGVPAPSGPAQPLEHLADAIHRSAGDGLADRTQSHFFSEGTLPDSADSYPSPAVTAGASDRGYTKGEGVPHLAAWSRDANGLVRWSLDRRCLADYGAALLPEAGRSALSALEHLFRGSLSAEDGTLKNGDLALGDGHLRVLSQNAKGARREVAQRDLRGAAAGETLLELPTPGEGETLVALFRGRDAHGEAIVVAADLSSTE